MRHPKRLVVGKDILDSNASQWRRNMADKFMHYGDVEPLNLYKGSVLRKIKQQVVDSELGVSKDTDPIVSIGNLKYLSEHQGSIHSIGSDPFFLLYWSPIQEHTYKTYRMVFRFQNLQKINFGLF